MDHIPFKHAVFAVFVLIVFGTSAIEIVSEFAAGETMHSMGDDLARFALSAVVRGQLAQIDAKSQNLANQYRGVMQKQFDAWQLTASEQDVVIGLLKGLSFREIAELRDTREKTVRQQASSVYKKAGVSSRNELAAWFFEDMLDPPTLENCQPNS